MRVAAGKGRDPTFRIACDGSVGVVDDAAGRDPRQRGGYRTIRTHWRHAARAQVAGLHRAPGKVAVNRSRAVPAAQGPRGLARSTRGVLSPRPARRPPGRLHPDPTTGDGTGYRCGANGASAHRTSCTSPYFPLSLSPSSRSRSRTEGDGVTRDLPAPAPPPEPGGGRWRLLRRRRWWSAVRSGREPSGRRRRAPAPGRRPRRRHRRRAAHREGPRTAARSERSR